MCRLKELSTLLVAVAAIVAPSSAAAAYVPPGNSAVNQYTQTVPTPGGNVPVHGGAIHAPSKALGAKNAHKLEEQGPEGQAAAELAAASGPPSTGSEESAGEGEGEPRPSRSNGSSGSKEGNGSKGGEQGGEGTHAAAGGSAGGGGGSAGPTGSGGSSGLGQVIGHATGGSSGRLGLLMPLLLIAAAVWCVAFLLRQRRNPA